MYHITLDDMDCRAIKFSGDRYSWSAALMDVVGASPEPGRYNLKEHEAWTIQEALREEDDAFCPLLHPDSNLYRELIRLESSII